jgi:hypothetical protein
MVDREEKHPPSDEAVKRLTDGMKEIDRLIAIYRDNLLRALARLDLTKLTSKKPPNQIP